jgi:hypothetical protein
MKPNIFVVGPSGSGKSSSLRNLNPETTIILNTEQKALPFRGSGKFKLNVPIANMADFHLAFEKAIVSQIADTIVIESFTSMVEQQFVSSGKSYSGFDLWADYQAEIRRILNRSKGTNKHIVFLGIDHIFEGVNGVEERCIAVQGALKKQIEKEFVIVLFTDMITNAAGVAEYRFITNKQKGYEHTGVKSPMEMLPLTMPNDLAEVISLANKYYSDDVIVPENPETTSN